MTQPIANLVLATSTFESLYLKTNELANALAAYAVTANSSLGETSGNAHLYGVFSSNTLVATNGLRGGNNSTSNTLVISSNTSIQQALSVNNNLTVSNLATFSAGINTTSIDVTTDISIGANLTINTTAITIGNSSTNSHFTSNNISVGNVSINTTAITIGATTINSTTLGESSNNSNYLDQHTWEEPKEIGGVTPNTAHFTTATINKISANGALGTTGDILKANSSGGLFWSTGGEGYTGSKGYTGSQGQIGYTGSKGDTGYSGSIGNLGYTGSRGSNGVSGDTGYTGSGGNDGTPGGRGYTGSVGFVGSIGTSGYSGSKGDLGFTGSSGSALNGYTGSAGPAGGTGSTGYTGSWGGTALNDVNMNNYSLSSVKSIGVGTTASASFGDIRATGNITAYYSDERLKTKLGYISNALEKVKSLDAFYFEPNQTAIDFGYKKVKDIGLSAQQVNVILPEAVTEAPVDANYLAVRYEKLIPLLIEAIKELNDKVESIK